ncbi:MAG: hypothetical protein AAFR52_01405 [Pseudomonadota bacterium]
MSTALFGMIEIFAFFGGVLAFALYQLHSLRKLRAREDAARARGEDPHARPEGAPRSREDIFWDTISKKRS